MAKRWSKTELAYLQQHAHQKSPQQLAEHLSTDALAVQQKLSELGLLLGSAVAPDPALDLFTQAWQLVHQREWQQASTLLQQVVATADSPQLVDRARLFLNRCEREVITGANSGDPYLRAVLAKNCGDLRTALELCLAHGDATQDERFAYLLASIQTLGGNLEEAIKNLRTAVRLEPRNRVHAYHDPDFYALRSREEFALLLAGR